MPSTGADDSSDEMWVSEGAVTPWREAETPANDDFVAEVSPAPAVVAVAVRVGTAPAVQRRVILMASAVVLGAMAIVGSLGMAAMMWPAKPAEAPSPVQSAPASHSNPPLEPGVPVMRGASVPLPTSTLVTPPQSAAGVSAPAVHATPGASVAIAPVSTAGEGQLRVTSAPSGARVTVNGIGWGQTPLTIDHLPTGRKTVRVTREGYASQERLVDIRSERPAATLHVTMVGEAGR